MKKIIQAREGFAEPSTQMPQQPLNNATVKQRIAVKNYRGYLPTPFVGSALLLLFTILFQGCAEKPPGYYQNDDADFSLVLPEGWHVDEETLGATVVAWRGERTDKSPTVTIVALDVPEQATNENFTELNFRDAAANGKAFTLKDERIALDGDSITARTYAYQIDGKWRQAFLASIISEDKRGYVINCSSLPERFQADKDEYMNILKSFKRE